MICQFNWRNNTPTENFWTISLEELYEQISGTVRSQRARFYMPGTERFCKADGYTLAGGYKRKRIIDIQRIQDSEGGYRYEEIEIIDFRIQRILERGTGYTTHAILPELFVPYKQYSLRYILFHLRKFFDLSVTQEAYCLDAGIDVKAFRQWLKWMRDHITVLAGLGLTKNYQDNWQTMRQWVQKLTADIFEWTATSLGKLNLGLFQEHPMPENTMYREYKNSGQYRKPTGGNIDRSVRA